jgi:hypothetical protein
MSQIILDEAQVSALQRAINQIMRASAERNGPTRDEVVHAVFVAACVNGEFEVASLVKMARANLARPIVKRQIPAEPRPVRRTRFVDDALTRPRAPREIAQITGESGFFAEV